MNEHPSDSDEQKPKQAGLGEPNLTTPEGTEPPTEPAPAGAPEFRSPPSVSNIPSWDEVIHHSGPPTGQPTGTPPIAPATPLKPKPARDHATLGVASLSESSTSRSRRDRSAAPAVLEVEASPATPGKRQLPDRDEALRTGKVTLELKLGARWLPILAVVAALATLAYGAMFGWDAYNQMRGQPEPGPWPRLFLSYLASVILFLAGKYFQRQPDPLGRFGRVLATGGLAAFYFATYGAHFSERLHVVDSPTLAGVLLLGCVACIIWEARYQRLEALGAFGIALGYLTSATIESPGFLYSANLVLSLVSVNLLLRSGWTRIAILSLVASGLNLGGLHWPTPSAGGSHPLNLLLILGYWCTYSSAVFLSPSQQLGKLQRAAFLSLNNIGFIFLVFVNVPPAAGIFWAFLLGFGVILLALGRKIRGRFPSEPLAHQAYLIQGIATIMLGAIVRMDGTAALAPTLAAGSLVLLAAALKRANKLLLGASLAVSFSAGLFGVLEMHSDPSSSLLVGGVTGAVLILNAWWFRRAQGALVEPRTNLHRAGYSALGQVLWLYATWQACPPQFTGPALAFEGVLFILSCYQLRIREITLFGQVHLFCGLAVTLAGMRPGHELVLPSWNPLSLIAVSIAVCFWWNRQKTLAIGRGVATLFESLAALGFVALSGAWIGGQTKPEHWLFLSAMLAVGVSGAGVATRAWPLAAAGQFLLLESVRQFITQLVLSVSPVIPEFYFTLAPPIVLIAIAFVLRTWLRQDLPAKTQFVTAIHRASWAYGGVGVLLSLAWVADYVPLHERIWVYALLGTIAFVWGGSRQIFELLLAASAYFFAAQVLFWHGSREEVCYWPNLAILLILGVLQQIAKRSTPNFQIQLAWHRLMVLAAGCGVWYWVSAWISEKGSRFYVTIGWAAVALVSFISGLFAAERMYRLLGLLVLVCSLVRAGFDVVQLDDFYKFISLFALSVVLGVLSYVYNRYQKLFLDDEWLAEVMMEQRQLHKRRRRKRGL